MKKNDLLLLISVVLYSWMFYHQSLGVNFLLFSVSLIVLQLIRNKALLKDTSWYVAAAGAIVSGVCVMLYGTWLSFSANIVSLSLVSAMSISRGSSVILGGIYALYSYVSSIGFMIVDMIERRSSKNKALGSKFWIKLSIGIGIFAILILFFFLYQKSNPLFLDLTRKINLDFISWPWVRFTFLGFLLLYGFFYHRNFPALYRWDVNIPKNLYAQSTLEKGNRLFGKNINENIERMSGVVLLALLNVLLLVVNMLDVVYLWISRQIPTGMTLSEYLHQGTGTLITSIVLAILIIMFYFRGYLNFSAKNKSIKILAYAWILQNAFVIISTGYRTLLYISEYNLTYKRLGVYIWLVLTMVGLITTLVKIYQKKTNLYLFKANGWAFYIVLVLFACLNWDLVITKFNIQKSKSVDKNYLVELKSPANLPDLLVLPTDEHDYIKNLESDDSWDDDYSSSGSYYDELFERGNYTAKLHKRLYEFLNVRDDVGWQSWNYTAYKTEKEIYALSEAGKIPRLLLSNDNISDLDALKRLSNLTYLDVSNNEVKGFLGLQDFDKLLYLDASSNQIHNVDSIPTIKNLKTLNLSNNSINDFKGMERMQGLEDLNIANNPGQLDLKPIAMLKNLKTLDISGNEIKNIGVIVSLNQLKTLRIGGMKNQNVLKNLPVMTQLEEVDISNNNFVISDIDVLNKFEAFKKLKTLNLSGDNITNLYVLTNVENKVYNFFFNRQAERDVKPIFTSLENLVLASNSIRDLGALQYYPQLKTLDLSNNALSSIDELGALKQLEMLDLENTNITNFDTLTCLIALKDLTLSSNNLADICDLSALKNLTTLDVSHNNLTNIDRFARYTNLRKLVLNNNQLIDLSPLKTLTKLEYLDVKNNSVSDYSPLYGLKNLKELRISNISLDDYNALKENLPQTRIRAQYISKRGSSY
jgi:Leucine-rich repeat (LRR) protein